MLNIKRLSAGILLATVIAAGPAPALELTARQVKMGSDLTMSSAQKIAEKLFKLDAAGDEPIVLLIATRAGYAPAAMVVVDAIRATRSKVYAVVQSEAFGVGAVVATWCDKRYAFPHASILFSTLHYDSEKRMKDKPPLPLEAAESYIDRVYAGVAKRIGIKADELKRRAAKGWFLTAAEAKKAGVAHEVVDRVTWVDLVIETVEVKRTSTTKKKRPIPEVK